jgi:hypothetical protein
MRILVPLPRRDFDPTGAADTGHELIFATPLSARWPGDVHTFAKTFAEMLAQAG